MTPPNTVALEDFHLPGELIAEAMSPALLIFLDHVRHNVARMIHATGGDPDRWRPHLKTTKMPVIWHELLDASVMQFKCATTREASLLLRLLDEKAVTGADLLIAYPLLGPGLTRAGHLAAAHPSTRVSILCEDASHVENIPRDLGIFVDVNPQMNRTGVPLDDVERILAIAHQADDRFRGVHFYDGHIRDDDPAVRRSRAQALYGQLLEIRSMITDSGMMVREIITSGTLTFEAALEFSGFDNLGDTTHRISPGTVVLHDFTSQEMKLRTDLRPAAVVMTRVVSQPADDVVTCDAGSKSIAAEAGDPCASVVDYSYLTPLTPSEEHLPIQVDLSRGPAPKRGDVLLLVPRHVCPTVNLAEQAILIEDGDVTGVVDVAGRGHELFDKN